jgi:hypothetical protein
MVFRPRIVWGYPGALVTLDLALPQLPWTFGVGGVGGSAVAASGIPEAYRIRKDRLVRCELRVHEDELAEFMDFLEWARESGSTFVFRFDRDVAATAHTVYLHGQRWEDAQELDFARDSEYLRTFTVPLHLRSASGAPFSALWREVTTGGGVVGGGGGGSSPGAPPGDGFQNQAMGLTLRYDKVWSSPTGWSLDSHQGQVSVVADASSPSGFSLRFFHPSGLPDGDSVGAAFPSGGSFPAADEVYFGIRMRYDSFWVPHAQGSKQHEIYVEDSGRLIVVEGKDGGRALDFAPRYHVGVSDTSLPHTEVLGSTLTDWHDVEVHIRRNTGTNDGFLRVWNNGVLQQDVTPWTQPSGMDELFVGYHIGTWGGGGSAVPHNQSYYIQRSIFRSS